jgi:hypothetical protein
VENKINFKQLVDSCNNLTKLIAASEFVAKGIVSQKANDFYIVTQNHSFDNILKISDTAYKNIYKYSDFEIFNMKVMSCSSESEHSKVMKILLNDQMTAVLLERYFGRENAYWSYFDSLITLRNIAYNVLNFIDKNSIEVVIIPNYPHYIHDWVIFNIAKALGIKIITITSKNNDLDWAPSIYCIDGHKSEFRVEKHLRAQRNDLLTEHSIQMIETGKSISRMSKFGNLEEGERIPKNKLKKGIFNAILNDLWWMKRQPFWWVAMNIYSKYSCYKEYIGYSGDFNQEYDIVFFLHKQPEMTTMPKGGVYAQQTNAILDIASFLPKEVRIGVMEHWSSWKYPTNFRYRPPNYFNFLKNFNNVKTIPFSLNSRQVLSNTHIAATVNGTIGIEALSAGVPVLAFGEEAPYSDHSLCRTVVNPKNIPRFYKDLMSLKGDTDSDHGIIMKKYLLEKEREAWVFPPVEDICEDDTNSLPLVLQIIKGHTNE